jgi:AraC family transcriptional regulator, regulatory protein of adaptative response / methylated-DNA-[protein]-cysteine methyltransferase
MSSLHTFLFVDSAALSHHLSGWKVCGGACPSAYGEMFLVATSKYLLALCYPDSEAALTDFQKYFMAKYRFSELFEDKDLIQGWSQRILEEDPLLILVSGTPFQLKVWRYLSTLPFGETTTYQKIARTIGHPDAARAVGSAVGANPVSLFLPCHRVLRKDGSLGGYRWGLQRKKQMLAAEGVF